MVIRLSLINADILLKGRLFQIFFAFQKLCRDFLPAHFPFAIHVDKLLVLILEPMVQLELKAPISRRIVLADYQVGYGYFSHSVCLSMQLLARLDRNLVDLRLIEIYRAAHPSFHQLVIAESTSLIFLDE